MAYQRSKAIQCGPDRREKGPPRRSHTEIAEELGVTPAMLRSLGGRYPEGYPQGKRGNTASVVYYVRKDFIAWWLALPEEVRVKAKAKKD